MKYIAIDHKHRVLFGTLSPTRAMAEHIARYHYGLSAFEIYPESTIAAHWGKR